jgi:hypothetical protein
MKAAIETQVCKKCGLEKPLSEFYFRNDQQKYCTRCKECVKKKQAVYREANREKVRACGKAWADANPEKVRAKSKAWREANPERWRANVLAWKAANLEKVRADNKAWREANRESLQTKAKAWRKANAEKHRAKARAWAKNNPKKVRANTAKRRAAKLQATPAWADPKKIEEIYLNCPHGYQVDHYFPLQSPIMCGLHVENNLQYLPAKENISKGNRVSLEEQLNG